MHFTRIFGALILFSAILAGVSAQSLAPGVDLNTIAFWPFDDSQYLNMTLTDAGPDHYDLRLRSAGRLSPGRYGNALEITSRSLPACMLAEWYGLQEIANQPDRPADTPTKIVDTLAGPTWTWEAWVRLRRAPAAEAALVHFKNANANAFYCAFAPQANALIVRDGIANSNVRIPLPSGFSPNAWHHVAIVKESRQNGVRDFNSYSLNTRNPKGYALASFAPSVMAGVAPMIVTYTAYVDGLPQGAAETISPADPGTNGDVVEWTPGLIGIIYADPDLSRPANAERVANLNQTYGLSRGTGWSGAWRGSITIPTGATITLRADALWGVRVRINNQLVINGWGPLGARTGTITLPANTLTTFSCELNQRDATNAHIQLYWSWPGHPEEIIPFSAFQYSTLDERRAQVELNNVEPDIGLVGTIYGGSGFTSPGAVEVVPQLNFAWGLTRGGGWSERFRGSIRSLTNQVITLRADCLWGLRIYIGNQLKLDGMSPAGPRTTSFTLANNTRTTFTVEYVQSQSSDARLKLYWSWPGHAEELVPVGMLGYSQRALRLARKELDPNLVVDLPARTVEFRVGTTALGTRPLDGFVDELRFSKSARYRAAFTPPNSLTYSYGVAPPATVPNGPAPLFCSDIPESLPLALGGRKHVFLDSALFESTQGLTITANPWLRREKTNYAVGGDPGVYDDGTTITLYSANADMWNGGITAARHSGMFLVRSTNGLTFKAPILNLIELDGTKANNYFIRDPVQGQVFIDDNPACPPEHKYKFTSLFMSRGLYLYTSPDGLHWTRNENNMLPPDCGGGVESFWDDQRGEYRSYIRHEGFLVQRGSTGRASALGVSTRPWAPWPFIQLPDPYLRIPSSMITLTTELPVPLQPESIGELFRVRTLKYRWASDCYFAFTWRRTYSTNTDLGDLGYSRDGLKWSFTGPDYYMKTDETVGGGATITSVIPHMGMVRRGSEVWNYANVQTTVPAQNGVYRYAQRLDGFFSLDAGAATGNATSKPLNFTGQRLQLNVKATGTVRVALVNADGSEIPAYTFANCTPITGDFTTANVSWNGSELISGITGPVRINLEMVNAKLYALQFTP